MKRFSIFYFMTGNWVVSALRFFFVRWDVTGRKNIPFKNPIIMAPNHQNAFMDALVATAPIHMKKQIGFMVRQDVFNNRIAATYLRWLLLFPAYRMRDGYENLKKNEESFRYSYRLLQNNKGVIIFPEGNHAIPRRLRPLKKGLMRAAFGAEEVLGKNSGLKIIPVGLNYSDPHFFGGEVLINYGEPFDIEPYQDDYRENPGRAMRAANEELANRMRPLMIDIQNKEYYDEIETIMRIRVNQTIGRKAPIIEKFRHQKQTIEKISAWIDRNPQNNLKENMIDYARSITNTGIRDWMYNYDKYPSGKILWNLLKVTCFFPVFVIGAILNILPFWLPDYIAKTMVRDHGFRSSIRLSIAMIAFPIWYMLLMIPGAWLLPEWYYTILIIPGGLLSGILAIVWVRSFNRLSAGLKYNRLVRKGSKDVKKVKQVRNYIREILVPSPVN